MGNKKKNILVFGYHRQHEVNTIAAFQTSINLNRQLTRRFGYLDDLSGLAPVEEEEEKDTSLEATTMSKESMDRFGPGAWEGYVEFDEFDGGDGQMGVAGDGNRGLEKLGQGDPSMAKSKMMSAKNAWGTSSGYAEQLRDQGVETSRAQQLENWHNQQEVLRMRQSARDMTDNFDQITYEEDWRALAKFGVERNQEFDLNESFGSVQAGDITDTFQIKGSSYVEFQLKNEYMGFADFRAAFSPETSEEWSVEPSEGSSSKPPVDFIVKFSPASMGVSEGYLVIETEDMKKTY